jgi:flagellar basal-body rod protein FlgC
MFAAMDISTSGLVAQRARINALASNIANVSNTRNEKGEAEAYQPRYAVFETDETVGAFGAPGVKVSEIHTLELEPRLRYEPNHPDAIQEGPQKGNVAYPNINMMKEFTDALVAARAYEANLGAMEITKDMEQQTLRILV